MLLSLSEVYSCAALPVDQAVAVNSKCSEDWLKRREVKMGVGSKLLVVDSVVMAASLATFISLYIREPKSVKTAD